MSDYCTHRLLIVGPTRDLKGLDRVADWKQLADAKDIALVDRSHGRRLATAIVLVAKLTPLIVAMLALLGLGAVMQMWERLRVTRIPA